MSTFFNTSIKGRETRTNFIIFNTTNLFIMFVLQSAHAEVERNMGSNILVLSLCGVHGIYYLICGFTCAVRRLHDTNRTAFYIIWFFIPLIAAIWLVYLMFARPKDPNDFGKNPRDEYIINESDPINK